MEEWLELCTLHVVVGLLSLALLLGHVVRFLKSPTIYPTNRHSASLVSTSALHQLLPYTIAVASHQLKNRHPSKVDNNPRQSVSFDPNRIIASLPPIYPNGWVSVLCSDQLRDDEETDVQLNGCRLLVCRGSDGVASVCRPGPVSEPHEWEVREVNGFILAWFHAESLPPQWEPMVLFTSRRHCQDDLLSTACFHGRSEHIVLCHVQDIPENGADIAHFNVVHREGVVLPRFVSHFWAATWNMDREHEHRTVIQYTAGWEVLGTRLSFGKVVTNIVQEGPGLVHICYSTPLGRIWLMQSVTTLSPLEQSVIHAVWAEPRVPVVLGKLFLNSAMKQFEKDIPIWTAKVFRDKPIIVKGDGKIAAFRSWYSQFYSKSSLRLAYTHIADEE